MLLPQTLSNSFFFFLCVREGLSFEDITIIPKFSDILSRKLIDTSSEIVNGIRLNIPFISSNMDTVTNWKMSVEMARRGGIGFIHRYMSVQKEARQVSLVKRKRNIIIKDPIVIASSSTLLSAKKLMSSFQITGVLVARNGFLEGVLSKRDYDGRSNDFVVKDLMTPLKNLILSDSGIDLNDAEVLLIKNKVEKLPLVNKSGLITGLITKKDLISMKGMNCSIDEDGRFLVGASIGVKDKDFLRAGQLLKVGSDVIVVDVAHGHTGSCITMVRRLKKEYGDGIKIIAGNVCTRQGVLDLVSGGVDGVKVGVGPGHACITRVVAGAGVPQITAIEDCKDLGVPIIADGGIRSGGDVAKAIGAGASTVMIGSLFAGTDEAPGEFIVRNGRRVKMIRGMASTGANKDRPDTSISGEDYVPEGAESFVEMKGPVRGILNQLVGGLKSGMSYSGSKNISEFWTKCEFMKVTPSFQKRAGSFGLGL